MFVNWVQEKTGEVSIGLEQNIIDTAINEWRKNLHAFVHVTRRHFKHFDCKRWKNGELDELSAEVTEMWTKYVFCVLFWLSNSSALDKNVIFH